MRIITIILFMISIMTVGGAQNKSEKRNIREYQRLFKSYELQNEGGNKAETLKVLTQVDSVLELLEGFEKEKMDCYFNLATLNARIETKETLLSNTRKYIQEINDYYELSDTFHLKSVNKICDVLDTLGLIHEILPEIERIFYFHIQNSLSKFYLNPLWVLSEHYTAALWELERYSDIINQLSKVIEFNKTHGQSNTNQNGYNVYVRGWLYMFLNRTKDADKDYIEAKRIFELLGDKKDTQDYCVLLRQMATFYDTQNRKAEAKSITESLHEFILSNNDKVSKEGIINLYNYAEVLAISGEWDTSYQYFLKVKTIIENNPDINYGNLYYFSLWNLSQYFIFKEDWVNVEFYLQKCELLFDKTHIQRWHKIRLMTAWAKLYYARGEYEKSKTYLLEGIKIAEHFYGIRSKHFILVATSLMEFEYNYPHGSLILASQWLGQIYNYNFNSIRNASSYLSWSELEQYCVVLDQLEDYEFSILTQDEAQFDLNQTYNKQLFKKGFVLTSISKIKNQALSNGSIAQELKALTQTQSLLADKFSQPLLQQCNIDSLTRQANSLEKRIAYISAEIGEELILVNTNDIRSQLEGDEACLEFVYYNFKKSLKINIPTYGVLILDKLNQNPVYVPLFRQPELDSLLLDIKNKSVYEIANTLYDKKEISDLIWAKILPHIVGKKRLYLSLAGDLHRFNLAAFKVDKQQRISDLYDIVLLNSTRDVIALKQKPPTAFKVKNALIIGAVDYDDVNKTEDDIESSFDISLTRGEMDFSQTDTLNRQFKWKSLKYSAPEIKSIDQKLSNAGYTTVILSEKNAREENIKQFSYLDSTAISPSFIHFSTHAYFFPSLRDRKKAVKDIDLAFKTSDQPLIRSGLILSGGNKAWSGDTALNTVEDGILTAYEVSQLNLNNTDLVVLSACETGLGDIQNSEGVYGLRRAFKIAGADKLIMSLWQVPDYQTMELMDLFYENLCIKKLPPRKSLQEAQKMMRLKKYEPYYWAGFVIVE